MRGIHRWPASNAESVSMSWHHHVTCNYRTDYKLQMNWKFMNSHCRYSTLVRKISLIGSRKVAGNLIKTRKMDAFTLLVSIVLWNTILYFSLNTPVLSAYWWRMAIWLWVNIGSSNGLLPDDTKPSSKQLLTNAFTWGQFNKKCSSYLSFISVWKLLIQPATSLTGQWVKYGSP